MGDSQANLEKQIKELNLRIVDLETKAYVSSPRAPRDRDSRRLESRIEELTNKLTQESKEKSDSIRMSRSVDKSIRDTKYQLIESDRQRNRLEDEQKNYEKKIQDLRNHVDELVSLLGYVSTLMALLIIHRFFLAIVRERATAREKAI